MPAILARVVRALWSVDCDPLMGDILQQYRQYRSDGQVRAAAWITFQVAAALCHGVKTVCAEWVGVLRTLNGSHVRSTTTLFTRHPWYAVTAVAVLATAVGANLVVFTVVNALWIRPAPYPNPERVVTIPEEIFRRIDDATCCRSLKTDQGTAVLLAEN